MVKKISIKSILSILGAKFTLFLTKTILKGGTTFPGKVALKLDSNILAKVSKGYKVVLVTGTNGKTTTTSMIYNIIKEKGYPVITNNTGANLFPGIVTTFIENYKLFKRDENKYAIIEVDEANLKYITKYITPEIITVTNLFRDQLDRYGEVYTTLTKILEGITLVPESKLVLNGDESLLGKLDIKNKLVFYGFKTPINKNKTIIPCNYNSASGKLKFKSSKFSTYVLCYVDTSKGTQTTSPVYPGGGNGGGGNSYIPGPAATITPTAPGTTQTPAPGLVPSSVPVVTPAPPAEPVPTTAPPAQTQTPAVPWETNKPEESHKPGNTASKVKTGDKVVVNNLKYTVTSVTGTRSVKFTGVKKKIKKVIIPASVKISGNKYKVTSIAANAFKNSKKLTKAVIGSNITKIGKNAFYGCKNLKNIVINTTKLKKTSVGAKAFKGTPAKAVVKVPKGKLKTYKKILQAKGLNKKATVK